MYNDLDVKQIIDIYFKPIDKINNFSRKMRDEWIDHGGFDVTDEYIKYLKEFVNVSKPKELFLGGKLYEV